MYDKLDKTQNFPVADGFFQLHTDIPLLQPMRC
jgi:hypothetical protein